MKKDDIRWDTAITLAELSTLAYTDAHNRTVMLRLIGFDKVVTLDEGPMSGFMAMRDDVVVVAFRGTDMFSPRDWWGNIDFYKQRSLSDGRKVHNGFQKSYEKLAAEIKVHLSDRKPKYIWLTGHSLGGAMAVCCAYDWVSNRMPLTGLITFGQPRVGNKEMAEFLDEQIGSRYLRFVNAEDIVPNVPTPGSWPLPYYQHAGEVAWFNGGKLDRNKWMKAVFKAGESNADETAVPKGNDAGGEISAEDAILLQDYLRATQPPEAAEAVPEELKGDAVPVKYGGPIAGPTPAVRKEFSAGERVKVMGLMAKFSDHAMLEYLRQLNDFRRSNPVR